MGENIMNKNKSVLLAASVVLAMALTISCSSGGGSDENNGIFTDSRDGKKYKVKDIGNNDIWFLDDLAYGSKTEYKWEEALISCPTGWHLPDNADWNRLAIVWATNGVDFSAYSTGSWWSTTKWYGMVYSWNVSEGSLEDDTDEANETNLVRCIKD